MAIDGVMIDVPDTAANLAGYGKPEGGTRRPFPQTRAVGLSECGTHALIAAELGTIYQGERELARSIPRRCWCRVLVLAGAACGDHRRRARVVPRRAFFSLSDWIGGLPASGR